MASSQYRTAPDPKATGWPSSIPYIIGNEGCERFSFYGMRAILYVYITGLYINYFGTVPAEAEADATGAYHLFNAAVYAFPIIGAILADRVLGKYRTIFWLSLVYCAGHACLAIFESEAIQEKFLGTVLVNPVHGLYIGLALIGIGSGGIKPCVSANVGDQFGTGNWHLLQKVFNAFYFIINFGSAFANIIIPRVRGEKVVNVEWGDQASGHVVQHPDHWAYAPMDMTVTIEYSRSVSWAFALPGILMGLATLFFWMGRKKYVHVPPTEPGKIGWLDLASGSALFSVIAIPIFGHEFVHSWLASFSADHEVSFFLEWGVILGLCAAAFALFLVLFTTRQRLKQDNGFLAVIFHCASGLIRGGGSDESKKEPSENERESWLTEHWFFKHGVRRFGLEATEGPVAVLKIICIFSFVSLFWALFDQHGSTWVKQAEMMDLQVDFSWAQFLITGTVLGVSVGGAIGLAVGSTRGVVSGWVAFGISIAAGIGTGVLLRYLSQEGLIGKLDPSQIQAANPFLVMLLIPYCNFGFYPLMAKMGIEPTPLKRMTLGMTMTGLSFVAVALIQWFIEGDESSKVHVFWQLIPYLILTLSEVMVSITGLEFAYSQAPRSMKSVIMGFWLLTVTMGNVIVTLTASFFDKLDLLPFFGLFAGMMFVAAAAFGFVSIFYKYNDYTQ